MHVTEHAKKRLKERNGLNNKSIDRMVQKALQCGISHNQTKGKLNKWMTSLFFNNMTACNIKLYGDKAYLFTKDERLITVLQIPHNLVKDMKNMVRGESKSDNKTISESN